MASRPENNSWQTIFGFVKRGHQIASGGAATSPYPAGSIALQLPYFQALGLDLSPCFNGTLNISIAPSQFSLKSAIHTFRNVAWTVAHPPETFSFSVCQVLFHTTTYDGYIYYPHPETKTRDFQDSSTLEILAPFIPDIRYGDRVQLRVNPTDVLIY